MTAKYSWGSFPIPPSPCQRRPPENLPHETDRTYCGVLMAFQAASDEPWFAIEICKHCGLLYAAEGTKPNTDPLTGVPH